MEDTSAVYLTFIHCSYLQCTILALGLQAALAELGRPTAAQKNHDTLINQRVGIANVELLLKRCVSGSANEV